MGNALRRSNIAQTELPAGTVIDGVWRPGLHGLDTLMTAFSIDAASRRASEQALLSLVEALHEILRVHRGCRQWPAPTAQRRASMILLLPGGERVDALRRRGGVQPSTNQGYTTKDYVRLETHFGLQEFEVTVPQYPAVPALRPFAGSVVLEAEPVSAVVPRL